MDRVIGGAISSFIKRIVLPLGGGSSHKGGRGDEAWKRVALEGRGRADEMTSGGREREPPLPPMLVASGNFLCLPHC